MTDNNTLFNDFPIKNIPFKLVYPSNSNEYNNILLIDNAINDAQFFADSVNAETFPIIYSSTSTKTELLALLKSKFTTITRIGIAFTSGLIKRTILDNSQSILDNTHLFLDNEPFFNIEENFSTSPYSENIEFILSILKEFNVINIDYLACDTLNFPNWKNYYSVLTKETAVSVGASNDKTGNLKYGGDWIMESTNQDVEFVYFTENIDYYKYLLDVGPNLLISAIACGGDHTIVLLNDGTVFGTGNNDFGQLGDNSTTSHEYLIQMKDSTGTAYITNVTKIACGIIHTIVLLNNGTVFATGFNNYGQLGDGTTTPRQYLVPMKDSTGNANITNVSAISASYYHTIVLLNDGTVFGTGNNDFGQLGDATTTDRHYLVQMKDSTGSANITNVSAISAGIDHTIVLLNNGTVFGTGNNGNGQLGDASTTTRQYLVPMKDSTGSANITNVSAIAAGNTHTIVLLTNGTVFGTGLNDNGQLGDGTTTSRQYVVPMKDSTGNANITNVTAIEAGYFHTIVLLNNGTVFGTGNNANGQLGDGTTTERHYLVQMKDSTGNANITNVSAIAAGSFHNIVLLNNGTVFGAGNNYYGQLGDTTTTDRIYVVQMLNTFGIKPKLSIKKIAVGYNHTIVLLSDGTVFGTGYNVHGELGDTTTTSRQYLVQMKDSTGTANITKVSAIACGAFHTIVLLSDGTVFATGFNGYGALGDTTTSNRYYLVPMKDSTGTNITKVSAIACGGYHTIVLLNDGTVFAAGNNDVGQLGENSTTALRPYLVQMKDSTGTANITNVRAIAAGNLHTIVLLNDGTVFGTGLNYYGQLGDGTTTNRIYVLPLKDSTGTANITNVSAIACGYFNTIVLLRNGTVFGTGNNTNGQLGDGTTTQRNYLVQMKDSSGSAFITNVKAIAASVSSTIVLLTNGTVFGAGFNDHGQLGDNTSTERHYLVQMKDSTGSAFITNVSAIASSYHTLVLLSDGTVFSTGFNANGQLGDNTITNRLKLVNMFNTGCKKLSIQKITVGGYHTIVLLSDGTVFGTGFNYYGQLGDGTTTDRKYLVQMKNSTGAYITKAIAIAGGGAHTIVLLSDGTVFATGFNGNGQLGDGTRTDRKYLVQMKDINNAYITNVIAIAAGHSHTIVLLNDGTVFGTGDNSLMQLGETTNTSQSYLVPMKDSTGTANISNVRSIACGYAHTIVLLNDGTVFCTGFNNIGQLGDGTTTNSEYLVQMKDSTGTANITNVNAIAGGTYHTIVLLSDGTVFGTGDNSNGQLGEPSNTSQTYVVQMKDSTGTANISNVTAIAAGGYHTIVLLSDGTVFGTGDNSNGQLGDATTTSRQYLVPMKDSTGNANITNVSAIAVGENNNTIVLLNNGTVFGTGNNSNGQLGDGTTTQRNYLIKTLFLLLISTTFTYSYNQSKHGPVRSDIILQEYLTGIIDTFLYSGSGSTVYPSTSVQPTNVGNYTALVTLNDPMNNMVVSSNTVNFSITKVSPTIAFTESVYAYTYDSQPHGPLDADVTTTPSLATTGATLTITYIGISGTSYSSSATPPTNVGTYRASATSSATNDYNEVSTTVNFSITKASPTIAFTESVYAYIYDSQPQGPLDADVNTTPSLATTGATLTITYIGISGTSYSSSATPPTNVGTYRASATSSATNNYNEVSTTVNFSITKASPTIAFTENVYAYIYDSQPHGPLDAYVNTTPSLATTGATLTITYIGISGTSYSSSATPPTNVGTYRASANSSATNNYNEVSTTVNFSITKASPTIAFTESVYAYIYDSQPQGPLDADVSTTPSFATTGATLTIAYIGISGTSYSSSATPPTNVGTYRASATSSATNNYNEVSTTVNFSITKASPTIAFTESVYAYIYDSQPQGPVSRDVTTTPSLATTGATLTITYIGISGTSYSSSATPPTNVGTYRASATSSATNNYNEASTTVNFSITKASPTIAFTESVYAYTYNSEPQGPLSTDVNTTPSLATTGATLTITYIGISGTSYSSSATPPTNVGTYRASATSSATNNYNEVSTTVNFSITKASPTIAFTESVYAYTYNSEPQGPLDADVSTTPSLATTGATLTITYIGISGTSYSSSATPPTNVGTYRASATSSATNNYNEVSTTVNFSITKASPTIAFTESVYAYIYDSQPQGPLSTDVNTTPSLATTGATLTIAYIGISGTSYSSSATPPTNVGTYRASATSSATNNYNEVSTTVNFSITKASPTIAFTESIYAYTYNSEPQGPLSTDVNTTPSLATTGATLTITYIGISGTTYSSSATPPTNVGTYRASATSSATANYNEVSTTVNFSITKASPTIAFTESVYAYIYDSQPQGPLSTDVATTPSLATTGATLTITYIGISGTTYSSSATPPTNVGTYRANATSSATNNYNEVSTTVNFSITKASPTIAFSESVYAYSYNSQPQGPLSTDVATTPSLATTGATLTFTYIGISGTSYSSSATPPTNLGTYTATATSSATANYNEVSTTVNFTIIKASPTIAFTGSVYTYTYNTQPHGPLSTDVSITPSLATTGATLTISYSGRSGTTYSSSATPPTNAGTYTATATSSETTNYNEVFTTVNFTINKVSPTISYTGSVYTYTYDNIPHGPLSTDVITTPSLATTGATITIIYFGAFATNFISSPTPPTNAGTYRALAISSATTNYNEVSTSVDFTITKVSPTIAFNESVYAYIYDSQPHGPLSTDVNTTPSLITTGATITITYFGRSGTNFPSSLTPPTNVGTYSAFATSNTTTNYNEISTIVNFSITKVSPTIAFTGVNYSYSYNSQPQGPLSTDVATTPSLATTGATLTITYIGISGTSYSSSLTPPTNIGTYTATATSSATNDYNEVSTTVNFTITKGSPTIAFAESVYEYTYDSQPHGPLSTDVATTPSLATTGATLTITYIGRSGTSYSSSPTPPTNIGTYTATAISSATANYNEVSTTVNFNIIKITPTIAFTESVYTYTYDSQPHGPLSTDVAITPSLATTGATLTIEYIGISGTSYSSSPTPPTNAGTYTATATSSATAIYNEVSSTVNFSITKVSPVIIFTEENYSYTYDIQPHGPLSTDVNTTPALATTGATLTITYNGDLETIYSSSPTPPTNVGTYTATATSSATANYNEVFSTVSFSITKALPTIAFTESVYVYTYDNLPHGPLSTDVSPTPSLTTTGATLTITYFGSSGTIYPFSLTPPTDVGTYRVFATSSATANYNEVSASVIFNIIKASPSIIYTGVNYSYTYDSQPHGPLSTDVTTTPSLAITGATITITYSGTSGTSYPSSPTPPTNVGTYTATATSSATSKYNEVSTTVNFTITKALPTIAFSESVYAYTYNSLPHGPVGTDVATIPSFATTGATLTFTYSGRSGTSYSSSPTPPTNVGTYIATATSNATANYNEVSTTVNFSITKASPTITFTESVYAYTYISQPQGPLSTDVTTTPSLANTGATITITYSGRSGTSYPSSPTPPTNVGTYTATGTSSATANYNEVSTTVNFSITKASPTIAFTESLYAYTYDSQPQGPLSTDVNTTPSLATTGATLTFTYSGFGGTSYSSSPTPPTNVGTYTATATSSATANYNEVSTTVNFSITKASPTIAFIESVYTYTYNSQPHGPLSTDVTTTPSLATTGATVNITYSGRSGTSYPSSSTPPTIVGTYTAFATSSATANYNEVSTTVNFSITKASPTIAFIESVYAYTYDNQPQGPLATDVTTTPSLAITGATITITYSGRSGTSYSSSSTPPTNVGTYTAFATSSSTANYNEVSTTVNFTITKALPTIAFTESVYAYTYDSQPQGPLATDVTTTPSLAITGATLTITYIGISETSYSSSPTPPTNVGTYTATATSSATANYNELFTTVNFSITKASPSIAFTESVYAYTYNSQPLGPLSTDVATIPSFATTGANLTITYNGESDTYYPSSTTPPTIVGTYTATATSSATANYNEVFATVSFSITKASPLISFTESVYAYTYDSQPHGPLSTDVATTPSLAITGAILTITYSGRSGTSYPSSSTPPTNVGTYTAFATSSATSNYNEVSTTVSFSITKASPTITFTEVNYSYTYDSQPHGPLSTDVNTTPSLAITGATLTITYVGRSGSSYPSSSTPPTIVGTYTATATSSATANYNEVSTTVNFSITKASPTIAFNESVYAYTYDSQPQGPLGTDVNTTPSLAITGATLTFTYIGRLETNYSSSPTPPTNVGTYTATATSSATANYNEVSTTVNFNITKASPTIAFTESVYAYTYDSQPQGPLSTDVNTTPSFATTGATLTISYGGRSGTTYSSSPTPPTNVGTYTAFATSSATSNYNEVSTTVNFSITKASPTIAFTESVYAYTYDSQPLGPLATDVTTTPSLATTGATLTITYSGFGGTNYPSSSTPPTIVGTYRATATSSATANYNEVSTTVNFSITKASPTIAFTEGNYSYTYDRQPHGPLSTDVATTPSLATTGAILTITYSGRSGTSYPSSSTPPTNVGTYTAFATSSATSNYNEVSTTVSFSITKASPIIAFNEVNYSYTYDSQPHGPLSTDVNTTPSLAITGATLTITYVGRSGSIYSSSPTPPTNVGTYTATATSSATANYNEVSTTVNFSITKASPNIAFTESVYAYIYDSQPHGPLGTDVNTTPSLTITGATLTITYVGRLGSSYSSSPTPPTIVGTYTATATSSATANYNEVSTTVNFSITKALQTITFTESVYAYTYDSQPHGPLSTDVATIPSLSITGATLTITYTGRSGTSYLTSIMPPINVGTYSALATSSATSEYNEVSTTINFTIIKASPTILYSQENYSYTYDSLPHGPVVTDVSTTPSLIITGAAITFTYSGSSGTSYSSSPTPPTIVGTYTATATSSATSNYNEVSSIVNFTIIKASPTIIYTVSYTYNSQPIGPLSTDISTTPSLSSTGATITITYTGDLGTSYPTSTTPPTNVGTYTGIASSISTTNFNEVSTIVHFKIIKASPSILYTQENYSYTYDSLPQGPLMGRDVSTRPSLSSTGAILTITYSGTSGTIYPSSSTPPTNVGTYTTFVTSSATANYNEVSSTVNFIIIKASPTILYSQENYSYTYDRQPHGPLMGTDVSISPSLTTTGATLTITYSGTSGTSYSSSTTPPTNVGTYTAFVSSTSTANYNAVSSAVNFIIIKATPSILYSQENYSYTYDRQPQGPLATDVSTIPSLAITGATLTITYNGSAGTSYPFSLTPPTNVGTYTAFAVSSATANYNEVSTIVNFIIIKATPTILYSQENYSYTYDREPQGPLSTDVSTIPSFAITGATLTITYGGRSGTSYPSSPTPPTNVGTYTAFAVSSATANYNEVSTIVNFIIIKASPTILYSQENYSYTYDRQPQGPLSTEISTIPSFAITGATLTITYGGNSGTNYSSSPTPPTNVGTYTAFATSSARPNYNEVSSTINFVIIKASPTILFTEENYSYYHDSTPHGPLDTEVTIIPSLSITGATLTIIYDGVLGTIYFPSTIPPTNFGTYTATAISSATSNYNEVSYTVNFTITLRPVEPRLADPIIIPKNFVGSMFANNSTYYVPGIDAHPPSVSVTNRRAVNRRG